MERAEDSGGGAAKQASHINLNFKSWSQLIRLGWKTLRHDGECVGVVFGLAWGLSDWKRDEPEGPEFGLRPRGPQWRLARRR